MRIALRKELEANGTPGTWSHVTDQIGMFSYTGMTESQCNYLIDKKKVYLVKNGRISMAGINTKNVKSLAASMKEAIENA
ncbi:hypothetical protein COB52_00260 [Candidatus Kaiserbacteria bacterium]|nr:MAG: hypothetical protein COB52_00260 [Candidatus Kaiserbacteria bacterium]